MPPSAQHRLKRTVTGDDPLKPLPLREAQGLPRGKPGRAQRWIGNFCKVMGRGGHSTLTHLPSTNSFHPLAAGARQPHVSPSEAGPSPGKLCTHTPAATHEAAAKV